MSFYKKHYRRGAFALHISAHIPHHAKFSLGKISLCAQTFLQPNEVFSKNYSWFKTLRKCEKVLIQKLLHIFLSKSSVYIDFHGQFCMQIYAQVHWNNRITTCTLGYLCSQVEACYLCLRGRCVLNVWCTCRNLSVFI